MPSLCSRGTRTESGGWGGGGCLWRKLFLHALPSERAAVPAEITTEQKRTCTGREPATKTPRKTQNRQRDRAGLGDTRGPGAAGRGVEGRPGAPRSDTPGPGPAGRRAREGLREPRSATPRVCAGAAPPPCPSLPRPVASLGTGPSPCAWRLPPGRDRGRPRVRGGSPGRGPGRGGERSCPGRRPRPPSLPPSLPPSPAPAAPAPRTTTTTTAAASRHVGRQAPGP